MAAADRPVEIIYLTPEREESLSLAVAAGTTIAELFANAAVRAWLKSAWLDLASVGVFGKRVPADYVLEAGDRVELYRPLRVNPKDARRERARRDKKRLVVTRKV